MSSLNKKPQEIIKVSWFPKDTDLVKFKTNNRQNSFFDSLAQDWANEEYKKAVRLNVLDKFLSKLQYGISEKATGPSEYTPKEIIKIVENKIKEDGKIQNLLVKIDAEFIFANKTDIREMMISFKKDPSKRFSVLLKKSKIKLNPTSLYFTLGDQFTTYIINILEKSWFFFSIIKSIDELETTKINIIERKEICEQNLKNLSLISSKTLSDPSVLFEEILNKYVDPSTQFISLICYILNINILDIRIWEKNDPKINKIISSPKNDYIILFHNETSEGVIYEPGGILNKGGKIVRKLNIKTHNEILEKLR